MSAATSVSDLALCRAVCAAVAFVRLPVHLCGPGAPDSATDDLAYPYAAVRPATRSGEPDALERTVSVRLVARVDPGDEKSRPQDPDAGWTECGAFGVLDGLADQVEDALRAASLGSRLVAVSREYPDEPETPLDSVLLTLTFSDACALGDSF